jgi:hypothetical protein
MALPRAGTSSRHQRPHEGEAFLYAYQRLLSWLSWLCERHCRSRYQIPARGTLFCKPSARHRQRYLCVTTRPAWASVASPPLHDQHMSPSRRWEKVVIFLRPGSPWSRHPACGYVHGLAKRFCELGHCPTGVYILRGTNQSPAAEPVKPLRRRI